MAYSPIEIPGLVDGSGDGLYTLNVGKYTQGDNWSSSVMAEIKLHTSYDYNDEEDKPTIFAALDAAVQELVTALGTNLDSEQWSIVAYKQYNARQEITP
jgi:hypothetical protein